MTPRQPVAPELAAIEVRGTTRGAFMMRGALAVSAAYGAAAVGPFVERALGQAGQANPRGAGDIEILDFALTLEWLEAFYYQRALKAVNMSSETKSLAQEIESNEFEHAKFLSGAIKSLGGKPTPAPTVSFPFAGESKFLQLAQTFEDTGVMAYNGAGPLIEAKDVLANAGRIAQVEGRHAAGIRMLRGQNPAEAAFDGVLSFQEVVRRVKPFVDELPFSFRQAEPGRGGLQGDNSAL